jgi:hypothetical protein
MDGTNEAWYVASDGVSIAGAAKSSASKIHESGFTLSGSAVSKSSDNILRVTPASADRSYFLFRKAGATSTASVGIKGSSGTRALAGIGGIRLIMKNLANAKNLIEVTTGADGGASLSKVIVGDSYSVEVPVQPGVAAAVSATVTPAYDGQSLGFLTVGETKANYKVSCSIKDGADFVYAGTPFGLVVTIANIGTEAMLSANYTVSPPAGLSFSGALLSDILGSVAPNGGTKKIEFTCTADAFAETSKVFAVPVRVVSQDGSKVWEDEVCVKVYREALSLYLRSASNEVQGIVINPDRSSTAFKTQGRSSVATFPSSDDRYILALSGADYTSETKYAIRLGSDPGVDGSGLTNSAINEPNDTEAQTTTLYMAQTKLGFLGVDDLDFYSLYSAYADGASPPAPPTGLVTTTGDRTVSLAWNDSDGATSYKVYYSLGDTTSTSGTAAAANPITGSSATVSNLTNGQAYAFIVVATNASGDGLPSSVATAKPGVNVSAFSASTGSGTVKLVWPVSTGATGYNLYYKLGTSVTTANGTKVSVTEPTATVNGLVNDSKYAFIYAPTAGGTEGAASSILFATPGSRPTQVLATANGNSINLAWTPVIGATGYNVYYAQGATATTASTKLDQSSVTGASAIVSGLDYGKQYSFIVTYVSGIESAASAVATAYAAPAAPTGGTAAATAYSGVAYVQFSWTAVTGATSYNLYWSTSTGVTIAGGTRVSGISNGSYLTTFTSNTQYYFILTAVGSGGESVPSAEFSAKTVTVAPSGLSAVGGKSKETLTWSAVNGAVSYNLYWSTNQGVTVSTGTKISGVTSPYTHTGLADGTTYYYLLTAVNSGGESEASNRTSALTTPATPTGLVATAREQRIDLNWSYVSGADNYYLYWSTSSGVTKANGTKVVLTSPSYSHAGITSGIPYYYVVTASNPSDESAISTEATGIPIVSAPTGVSAAGGSEQVIVSWPALGEATSYNIYWAAGTTVTTATGTKVANATSPKTIGGLTNGVRYAFIVTAVNGGGEGAASSGVTALPGIVYTTGYWSNGTVDIPCYWVDTARTDLSGYNGRTSAAYVDSGILYTAGYYYDSAKTMNIPCYWAGTARIDLSAPKSGTATSICVSAGTVYVAGYYYDSSLLKYLACYWVNGARTDLVGNNAQAMSIFIYAGKVYVAGNYLELTSPYYYYPCYWIDGVKTDLSSISGGSNKYAVANSILVASGKVYAAGYYIGPSNRQYAAYWVDGARTDLSSHFGSTDAIAQSIFIADPNIYVAGSTYDYASIWINGSRSELSSPAGLVTSVAFYGNTLYAAGSSYISPGTINIPCYWLDYSRVNLAGDGVHSAYATGLVVR